MTRLLYILIVALVVGSSLAWLADHPGNVVAQWEGWLIETSVAVLAAIVALILLLSLLVQRLWHWLRADLPFLGSQRHLRRQIKGLDAMNRSVLALASGRTAEAERLIARTKRLLPPQPMLHILESQVAQLSGNKDKAKVAYEALLDDKNAAIIGIRGLFNEAISEGRSNEALRLIEAARQSDPKSSWAIEAHFDLLVSQLNWKDALALLKGQGTQLFSNIKLKRNKLIVNYCLAKEADLAANHKEARALANTAYVIDKGFEPLVLLMVHFNQSDEKKAKASSIIEQAWKLNPSQRLAEAYAQLNSTERPAERFKRFEKLISKNKSHNESKLQRAERALAAERYDLARPIIESYLAKNNEPRAFELKALLVLAEGGEKAENEAEAWRLKGHRIASKPAYYCQSCYTPSDIWLHHCANCGKFDGLVGAEFFTKSKTQAKENLQASNPSFLLMK